MRPVSGGRLPRWQAAEGGAAARPGLVDPQPPEVQQRVWAKVIEAWAPFTIADGRVRLENQAVWVTGTE